MLKASHPNTAEELLQQGSACLARNDFSFEQVLDLDPNHAQALNKIGEIHLDQDNLEAANHYFKSALSINSGFVEALYNVGVVSQKKGDLDDAVKHYEQALAIDENYSPARWLSRLSLPVLYETENQIHTYRKRLANNLVTLVQNTPLSTEAQRRNALQGLSVTSNVCLQYQGLNDIYIQQQYGRFAVNIMAANFPHWADDSCVSNFSDTGKIRVGYVSSCMYGHTIGVYLLGWLKNLNHEKFEWFAYHVGSKVDQLTQQISQAVDHFHHYPGNLAGTARRIEKDCLHILVHTDIGMNPITLQLAALRLAPIQCKGWGHPVTTGLPTVDYYLSSDLMEQDDSERYYAEKLIRLPNLALNYTPPALPENPAPRNRFNIPEDAVVYLTTQSLFKYLPQHDDIFPRIAKQVPNAVFVFVGHKIDEITQRFGNRLSKCFEQHGVSGNCIFVPRMPYNDFLSLNMNADVLLDTLVWSGGKTSLEAIACDLPVVTLPGDFMRGRHTYAFLKRMGLDQTIATDKTDYIQKAVQLGADTQYRDDIRSITRERKHLLYNDVSVTTALEQFFERTVQNVKEKQTIIGIPGDIQSSSGNRGTTIAAQSPYGHTPELVRQLCQEGSRFMGERCWDKAGVTFERALAYIPNYLGVQPWFQQYLLDGYTPALFSSEFVADLYAQLSHCRFKTNHYKQSLILSDAALRLHRENQPARQLNSLCREHLSTQSADNHPHARRQLPDNAEYSDHHCRSLLTVVMFSNFTEKLNKYKELSPPTTGLAKATMGSVVQSMGQWIMGCKKWLCYDAPDQATPEARQYEKNLTVFSSNYDFSLLKFEYAGLQRMVRKIIDLVDTPYLLFLEHDWFISLSLIDTKAILLAMDNHPDINSVRFSKRPNIVSNYDFLLAREHNCPEVPLLRTPGHSNNPHILRVSTFRDQWLPICLSDPVCTQWKMRGTAFGIENPLFKKHLLDIRQSGFEQAHTDWGTYVYGDYNAPAGIVHLGE